MEQPKRHARAKRRTNGFRGGITSKSFRRRCQKTTQSINFGLDGRVSKFSTCPKKYMVSRSAVIRNSFIKRAQDASSSQVFQSKEHTKGTGDDKTHAETTLSTSRYTLRTSQPHMGVPVLGKGKADSRSGKGAN